MQLTGASLESLIALCLRSLRHAPTGLAALLSATADALDARLVAACLVPSSGPPETLGAGGPDGPGLSQRTGEDHEMLSALSLQLEAGEVPMDLRAGAWNDYAHVSAVASCIDEDATCIVVAGGHRPLDPQTLLRASAPVAMLAFVIAQEHDSRELRHRALEADQQLSLLLAGLHHDLRTPLTGILGSAQTLINRDSQIEPDLRQELLESIVRQADRLNRMVSETLDRGRDKDRPVVTTSVNLRDLAERAAAAANMGRPGSIVVEAPDVEIFTDADRVERALLNLLDNALKYSVDEAAVYLIAELQEGWSQFTIADNGPGVAHDVMPRLFGPYVSDRTRADGTGLGLNSAKQVVEEDLGGRISYSRHDGWTRFVVAVPNDPAACS